MVFEIDTCFTYHTTPLIYHLMQKVLFTVFTGFSYSHTMCTTYTPLGGINDRKKKLMRKIGFTQEMREFILGYFQGPEDRVTFKNFTIDFFNYFGYPKKIGEDQIEEIAMFLRQNNCQVQYEDEAKIITVKNSKILWKYITIKRGKK